MGAGVGTALLIKIGGSLFWGYWWSKWRFDMFDPLFAVAALAGVFLVPMALAHFPIVAGGKAMIAGALIGCLAYDVMKHGLD